MIACVTHLRLSDSTSQLNSTQGRGEGSLLSTFNVTCWCPMLRRWMKTRGMSDLSDLSDGVCLV